MPGNLTTVVMKIALKFGVIMRCGTTSTVSPVGVTFAKFRTEKPNNRHDILRYIRILLVVLI